MHMAFVTVKLMDKYEFLDRYSEESTSRKLFLGIVSLILILGVGLGVYLTQTQKTITKTQASKASKIQVVSPKSGDKIFGDYPIKVGIKTEVPIKYLHGVLKVDETDPQTLSLLRLDPESVSLSTDLNTRKYTQGTHNIGVFIYDLTSGKPILIESLNFDISIEN